MMNTGMTSHLMYVT